jgi:hypothetical protein
MLSLSRKRTFTALNRLETLNTFRSNFSFYTVIVMFNSEYMSFGTIILRYGWRGDE